VSVRLDERRVVLYAVGSPLAVDAEEACLRAGLTIVAGVRNVDAPVHVTEPVRIVERAALTDAERACGFVVALFTPGHRRAAVEDARRAGFARGATLIDPSAAVARSAQLGEGVFVNAGAVVAGACQLGDWVIVNRSASVGHHTRIGDYASIGPGAVLCGYVSIGRGTMIGAGSVVLPGVAIGSNSVIAAGSLVRDPIADNSVAEGHPCRVVQSGVSGYKGIAI
jgi:sugar O-acyltransferase (sialic acid O-acetyltransferase NeuD family)